MALVRIWLPRKQQLPNDSRALFAAFLNDPHVLRCKCSFRLGAYYVVYSNGVTYDQTTRFAMPQLEQGDSQTSVTPTRTVAVTQSAETCIDTSIDGF